MRTSVAFPGRVWLAALALTAGISAAARAQTTNPSSKPTAAAPLLEKSARHTDAHADRVILVPTAETQPMGTLFASSYELLLLGVGYAPTDRLHLSIVGVTDLDNRFVEANIKVNLLRSRFIRFAAQSSIDNIGGNGQSEIFGRAGATLQICFELRCATSLSVAGMLVLFDEPNTVLPAGFGAGFTMRLNDDLSALLEYSALINAARDIGFIDLPAYLVGYGLRIAARTNWALDIALLRRMQNDREIRSGALKLFDVLGTPFVAFTYRGAI